MSLINNAQETRPSLLTVKELAEMIGIPEAKVWKDKEDGWFPSGMLDESHLTIASKFRKRYIEFKGDTSKLPRKWHRTYRNYVYRYNNLKVYKVRYKWNHCYVVWHPDGKEKVFYDVISRYGLRDAKAYCQNNLDYMKTNRTSSKGSSATLILTYKELIYLYSQIDEIASNRILINKFKKALSQSVQKKGGK
ncbi:MAG: hypothetical protein U9O94_09295 [Nanoarchaeota archaeon]|nr:hypothetical protein [Nanoarchaeota archaeon]